MRRYSRPLLGNDREVVVEELEVLGVKVEEELEEVLEEVLEVLVVEVSIRMQSVMRESGWRERREVWKRSLQLTLTPVPAIVSL